MSTPLAAFLTLWISPAVVLAVFWIYGLYDRAILRRQSARRSKGNPNA